MGVYVYGITRKTRKHPEYGDVNIAKFIAKDIPFNEGFINRMCGLYSYHWKGKEMAKYFAWEGDEEMQNVFVVPNKFPWFWDHQDFYTAERWEEIQREKEQVNA
jgi:hypothetical protein